MLSQGGGREGPCSGTGLVNPAFPAFLGEIHFTAFSSSSVTRESASEPAGICSLESGPPSPPPPAPSSQPPGGCPLALLEPQLSLEGRKNKDGAVAGGGVAK